MQMDSVVSTVQSLALGIKDLLEKRGQIPGRITTVGETAGHVVACIEGFSVAFPKSDKLFSSLQQ